MRFLVLTGVLMLAAATVAAGGPARLDVSPAALVNVGSGHSGDFMGSAVTADLYFNRAFALRTTLGFTKNRYYPPDLDYADANYGFWLSIAPYAEMRLPGAVHPYLAMLGTFSSGPSQDVSQPTVNELAPVNRIQPAESRSTAYSLGGTLGTKVGLAGRVALFVEVTHFFYSSVSHDARTFENSLPDVTFNYDWDRNPTYLSLGLTYSVPLKQSSD